MKLRKYVFALVAGLFMISCSSNRSTPSAATAPPATAPAVAATAPPATAAAPAPATAPPTIASPATAPSPEAAATGAVPGYGVSPSVQEILKLKQAGYSDDFLVAKIKHDNIHYDMNTNDLLALRQSGIAEPVIETMMHSGTSAAALPSHMEWDGLARQKRGFLGVGSSTNKYTGKLTVDGANVSWNESVDPDSNFSMLGKNIKEMWLNCAPRAGENLCLELCFKTYAGDERCFRDTGWENGENKTILAIYDYFQKAFPATLYSRKEKKSF